MHLTVGLGLLLCIASIDESRREEAKAESKPKQYLLIRAGIYRLTKLDGTVDKDYGPKNKKVVVKLKGDTVRFLGLNDISSKSTPRFQRSTGVYLPSGNLIIDKVVRKKRADEIHYNACYVGKFVRLGQIKAESANRKK